MVEAKKAEQTSLSETMLHDGFQLAETRRTLPIALLRSREAVMELFRPMLRKYDITEQQWRVIRVLFEVGAMDATKLADLACILPPSLTRILKILEARKLVSACKDPKDRRHTIVKLSKQGEAFIHIASKDSVAIYGEIEGLLGKERIQILLNELEFIQETLMSRSVG